MTWYRHVEEKRSLLYLGGSRRAPHRRQHQKAGKSFQNRVSGNDVPTCGNCKSNGDLVLCRAWKYSLEANGGEVLFYFVLFYILLFAFVVVNARLRNLYFVLYIARYLFYIQCRFYKVICVLEMYLQFTDSVNN